MKLSLLLVVATSCATGVTATTRSWAQQAFTTAPINVRNVKPSIIAYWLDPVHHPLPAGVTAPPAPINPENGRRFGMAVGINRVEPDDDKNQLIATGTPEAITYLSTIVAALDRPNNQPQGQTPAQAPAQAANAVEFMVQRMQVSPTSLGALGIAFSGEGATPDSPRLGTTTTAKLRATVATLVAQNKAKVLSAPVATSLDALVEELQKAGTQTATLGIQGEDGIFHPFSSGTASGGIVKPTLFSVQLIQKTKIESVVNDDGTVKVTVNIEPRMQMIGGQELPPTLTGSTPQSFSSQVKAHEGDIVALVMPGGSKNGPMSLNVVLLMPRVVPAATNK